MPNRCGIIHVRGPMPPNRISHGEVLEWQKTFEEKLTPLLSVRESLSEEEAQKMGRKDPEQEVEKFVTSNTQELGKDKWLCPLSGKKFKGPEFVRKHIFNKHAEKIEEVKKEVAFFNNFLTDAKRPALPEIKPAQPPGPAQIIHVPVRVVLPPGLTPGLPYPHQTPQGLMPYGQPRREMKGLGECSPQEALHTPMPHTVLVEGTTMPSEAREVILGNLATGWFGETQGPLWNIGTWMPQTMLISFELSTVPHSCIIHTRDYLVPSSSENFLYDQPYCQ
uniref:Arsenite-resistance protein 2 n=1 Tax=Rhinopithecus roxellana TaxID=61622 RepID=A0A2K6P887_RHIRO